MRRIILLAALLTSLGLTLIRLSPLSAARASAGGPVSTAVAPPQAQGPRPIRTLPGLEEIRVWVGREPLTREFFCPPNHPQILERRAALDSLNKDTVPFGEPGDYYDVFYSDADGMPNVDGAYVTLEAVSSKQAPALGGGNVAEVGLRFTGSTTFEYGNVVASFVALGNNADPALNSNAIDGNTQTSSTLGNTVGQSQRLRITIGFLSSLGPPPSALRTVGIEDAEVREGNAGTMNAVFKVKLSAPGPAPVTVAYSTQDFTAAAPDDYAATSGTLTFPANSSNTLMTIIVPVRGDTLYEAAEQFFVNLTGPVNAGIERGQATGTIFDDEPGAITLCSNDTPNDTPKPIGIGVSESTINLDREGMVDDVDVAIYLSYTNDFAKILNTNLTAPDSDHGVYLTKRRDENSTRRELAGNQLGTTCSPSPDCIFDDDADTIIYDGLTPYIGRFKPEDRLGSLERKSGKGAWRLSIDSGGPGTFHCWCLTFAFPREGCNLRPANARVPIFGSHSVQALLTSNGAPVANQPVSFEVRGEQGELRLTEQIRSNDSGAANLRYSDFKPGKNTIEARALVNGVLSIAKAQVTWVANGLSGPRCPIESVTDDTAEAKTTLTTARSFRDDVLAKSPRGKAYTDLYYKFSSEAVQVMMFNPMLMLRSREIIERYKPVIQSIVNGERVTLTRSDLNEVDAFLNSFAAKGSPQLQRAVKEVCDDLKSPSVHDEFHITVVEGPKREMPAHHLLQTINRAGGMASLLGFCLACIVCLVRRSDRNSRTKARRFVCVALAMLLVSGQWSVASGQSRITALPSSLSTRPETNKPAPSRLSDPYGKLPLAFEVNQGQADSQVSFLSRGNGYSLLLMPTEAAIRLRIADCGFRIKMVGANLDPKITGLDRLPAVSNYFVGNDTAKWRANVPAYARVKYDDLYPGVDMVYYGNQRELEYDFIVAPGADPRVIRLNFDGPDKVRLDEDGDLVLTTAGGEIRQRKPVAYQEINGARRIISSRYVMLGDQTSIRNPRSAIRNQEVGFELGDYDTTRPLIIDPVLAYSTYLGGSGDDEGNSITVDSSGNLYVVGFTDSVNFPTSSPSQPSFGGGQQDLFVTKLNPSGTQLIYSTYLGGNGQDNGSGIAVDSAGNAYITGFTGSTNFPVQNALQPAKNGQFNAFVAKLDPTGSLLYSTHLGGSTGDFGSSITVDSSGNVYVAGVATSSNFPMVNALQPSHGGAADLYVAKLNPSGSQLVYSTYLGGSGNDGASAIAVDSVGSVYLTGVTTSQNFRTASPLQASHGGGLFDAFVAKVNPSGNKLVYSTYLGGGGEDRAFRIAVDSAGNAYVTGDTDSTNFPTANALQGSISGSVDAFVSKINAAGSALVYSTYLGGSGIDGGTAIAVDSAGSAYAAGFTGSTNFPTIDPVQQANGGGSFDAFVAKLSSSGAALEWSSYLGGSGIDAGFGIAVDSSGTAYVMGQTESTNFPTASPLQPANGGGASDLFIAKIVPTGGTGPRIADASVSGKKLLVFGSGFDLGAKILLNDEPQKTTNDEQNAATALIAKKSGKKIAPGQIVTLQVRNSDGTLSNRINFTR